VTSIIIWHGFDLYLANLSRAQKQAFSGDLYDVGRNCLKTVYLLQPLYFVEDAVQHTKIAVRDAHYSGRHGIIGGAWQI
jgi:hypothetical protein